MNVCNQLENHSKRAKKQEWATDCHKVGTKVTTKMTIFEDAADALLMEISKMLSKKLNGVPAKGQTQIVDMSRPGVDGTATDKDIEAELFDGLCQTDADQFRADNRLGLERIRMKEGNGAPLYMRDMMRSDKPRSTATSKAQSRTPERPRHASSQRTSK